MKYSILTLLLVSQIALADCDMKSASLLKNEHDVGPITNLVTDKGRDTCSVKFDITVNGVTYHLSEKEKGLEQVDSLCYYAKERARKNLLLDLGGKFQSEAVTVCKEGEREVTGALLKIAKGEVILENEVHKDPARPKYFSHKGAKCRFFREAMTARGDISVNHGVICQIADSDTNWLIVDKW